MWLLSGAASVAVCLAAAIWYLHRPPPPLRITKYTQITLDGQRKGVSARDGRPGCISIPIRRIYRVKWPHPGAIGCRST